MLILYTREAPLRKDKKRLSDVNIDDCADFIFKASLKNSTSFRVLYVLNWFLSFKLSLSHEVCLQYFLGVLMHSLQSLRYMFHESTQICAQNKKYDKFHKNQCFQDFCCIYWAVLKTSAVYIELSSRLLLYILSCL